MNKIHFTLHENIKFGFISRQTFTLIVWLCVLVHCVVGKTVLMAS